jgi:hypothetical protein
MINERAGPNNTSTRLAYLLTLGVVMVVAFGSFQSGNLDDNSSLVAVLFAVTLFWIVMINASLKSGKSQERLLLPLIVAVTVLLLYGVLESKNWQDGIGFAAVLLAAAAPAFFWIRSGIAGVPILPAVSVLYVIYFGLSAVRGVGEQAGYTPHQVLTACLTVAVFLMVATVVSAWICANASARRAPNVRMLQFSDRVVVRLIFAGFSMGLLYYIGDRSGLLDWLGTLYGVMRGVSMSAVSLASFLLGHATARKSIPTRIWLILCGCYLALLFLSLSSLFLAGVMTITLAALAGYVVTAKRVPWRLLAVVFLAFSVFQAGKKEMRLRHWEFHSNYSNQTSIAKVPNLIAEWFGVGTDALLSGTSESSIVDRASLLNQLIRVEDWTPKITPFLYGDTYTYLPYIIVPRFVLPDKPTSQVVMNKLDIRYGFLTPKETRFVAVGINLIPEGFANFGYFGIVLIGIVFGAVTGYFTRISINRSPISLPVLLSIVTLVTLLDLEADLSSLLTTLSQSLISVMIFFFAFQFVSEPAHRKAMLSRVSKPAELQRSGGPLTRS